MRLVLQNLVSNAVKFAAPESPCVTVACERDRSLWRVCVEDNGPGVPDGDRERIFGAFERARTNAQQAGYGLGLAICKRIVDRNDGDIGLEGANRFWFALPAGD